MEVATEEKVLATNGAAFHDYHISTKYEAGAALMGTEVKSVLDGRIQLKESYVAVRDGEAWLFNAHISPYSHGNINNHDPLRTRKLLLHRREIDKLDQAAATDGMTLVVTRVYIKHRKIKRLLLVGCGERDSYKSAQVTQMAGTSTRFLRGKSVQNIAIAPRSDGDVERVAQTVVVGAVMGLFEPDKYRTKDKEKREIK